MAQAIGPAYAAMAARMVSNADTFYFAELLQACIAKSHPYHGDKVHFNSAGIREVSPYVAKIRLELQAEVMCGESCSCAVGARSVCEDTLAPVDAVG